MFEPSRLSAYLLTSSSMFVERKLGGMRLNRSSSLALMLATFAVYCARSDRALLVTTHNVSLLVAAEF